MPLAPRVLKSTERPCHESPLGLQLLFAWQPSGSGSEVLREISGQSKALPCHLWKI